VAGAEVLHRDLGQAGFFQRSADRRQVGRLFVADLDQGAAGEIDAEIEAAIP